MIKLGQQEFVKSSHSATGNCVIIGSDRPTAVKASDSKFEEGSGRPVVTLSPAAYTALVDFARSASV